MDSTTFLFKKMYKIKIINGPNMNMLGIREKEIYGRDSYEDLVSYIKFYFRERKDIVLEFVQSNYEGKIIDEIQSCYFDNFDGIVINPAGYTHTSVAILDALKAVNLPTIEVHMSDIKKREEYRNVSYVSEYCLKRCIGKGKDSYVEAISALIDYLKK